MNTIFIKIPEHERRIKELNEAITKKKLVIQRLEGQLLDNGYPENNLNPNNITHFTTAINTVTQEINRLDTEIMRLETYLNPENENVPPLDELNVNYYDKYHKQLEEKKDKEREKAAAEIQKNKLLDDLEQEKPKIIANLKRELANLEADLEQQKAALIKKKKAAKNLEELKNEIKRLEKKIKNKSEELERKKKSLRTVPRGPENKLYQEINNRCDIIEAEISKIEAELEKKINKKTILEAQSGDFLSGSVLVEVDNTHASAPAPAPTGFLSRLTGRGGTRKRKGTMKKRRLVATSKSKKAKISKKSKKNQTRIIN